MKRRKGMVCLLCLLLVCSAILPMTGCTTKKYNRRDIYKYVQEVCGLESFTVSKEPILIEGEDGYTDRLWTVIVQDGSELTFHVLDDFHWGMESVTNDLRTDYDAVVLKQIAGDYTFTDMKLEHDTNDAFMESAILTGDFESREELVRLLDEMEAFLEQVAADGRGIRVPVRLRMESILRNRCSYEVDDGDFSDMLYPDEGTGAYSLQRDEAMEQYLLSCVDYRFEDQLAAFTPQEIADAVSESQDRISISRSGDKAGPYETYPDLCASCFSYGVSFGTLYEILSREGVSVSGDSWHYSFTGTDGSVYEISYDFCDYVYSDQNENEDETGYYYLKDGEETPMSAYFYNHFTVSEIEKMTGLILRIGDAR